MPLDWLTRLDPLRRVRCPFCFERFAACEMHLRCNDHYCKTDFARMIDDPILSQALNGRQRGGAGRLGAAEPLVGRPAQRPPPRAPPAPRLDGPARRARLPELRQADRPAALSRAATATCPTRRSRSTRATSPSSGRSRSARRRT